jgi:DNA helicase-4
VNRCTRLARTCGCVQVMLLDRLVEAHHPLPRSLIKAVKSKETSYESPHHLVGAPLLGIKVAMSDRRPHSDHPAESETERLPTWRPGPLARLLFSADWTLEVRADGIRADGRLIPWVSCEGLRVEPWLLWGHLKLPDGLIDSEFKGVPRGLARELKSAAQALRTLTPAIQLLRDAWTSSRYVPNRLVRQAVGLTGSVLPGWSLHAVPRIATCLESLRVDLNRLTRLVRGDLSEVNDRNERFVQSEFKRFEQFFGSVESKALTQDQRLATVVMEDRNLVIAAAGSGKTSVIVARIGYLVQRKYANPDEILVLSFNTAVAEEIKERVQKRLVGTGILAVSPQVRTFHAYGLEVIQESGPRVRLAKLALSTEVRAIELQKIFEELVGSDSAFSEDAIRFLGLHWTSGAATEASDLASELQLTWDDLVRKPLKSISLPSGEDVLHITLSGESVRSKQELMIANWLTLMGIEFKYELHFPEVPGHPWTQDYRPDFYYPQFDLWHEHFGINVFGKAPAHFGKSRSGLTYEDQVAGKRAALVDSGLKWFETTSADFERGDWETKLRSALEKAGAKPASIGWPRFRELLAQSKQSMADMFNLFGSAITHFKGNGMALEDLKARADDAPDRERSQVFARLFEKLFERYEQRLDQRKEIDFDDMLRLATKRLRAGSASNFKAILIDEFQDMSNARAELICALLEASPDATLFAVGDDWQSVYRFTGSDISVMTEFEERFGFTRKVTLGTTFRCNQGIADVSSEFVRRNPRQIAKSVSAVSDTRRAVIRVVFHSGSPERAIVRQLEDMAAWASHAGRPADVCLLGRYNFLEPPNFTALAERFKDHLNLSFSSIHRSKGLGFDFVIVLGMTDKAGSDFPATRQDDPLLSLFMPTPDALEFAEERRLFYVAMTRAKRACVLVVPKFGASSFIREVLGTDHKETVRCVEISQDEECEVPEPLTSSMQQICPECRRGRLLPRIGPFGRFMVCERKDRGRSQCKNVEGHVLH